MADRFYAGQTDYIDELNLMDVSFDSSKFNGTSTTSLSITVASKVFVTQSDKFFDVGRWLLITSDADPANYMHGQVTSYSGTALTVNVTNIGGSGTLGDWDITVSGTQGAEGDLSSLTNAVGNINQPLLFAPFKNSLTLPIGVGSVTFSRSTTATYVDRYGVVQSASIDESRFEADGVLLEGASENLCTFSEDTTDATWTDPVGEWSTVANNTTAPDGVASSADTITLNAGDNSSLIRKTIPSITAGTYAVSFFIKDITGNLGAITIDIGDEDNGVITGSTSSKFTRVHRIITTTGAHTTVDIDLDFTGASNDVSIWGLQVEELPFVSSYIPRLTAATATRTADDLQITQDNNVPDNSNDLTVLLDFIGLANSFNEGRRLINITPSDGDLNYLLTEVNSSSELRVSHGALFTTGHPVLSNQKYRSGLVFDSSASKVFNFVDGVRIGTGQTSTFKENNVSNPIEIGQVSGVGYFYGHVSNLRIYDISLTLSEMAIA